MKKFKEFEVSNNDSLRIIGGNGGSSSPEEVPMTTLGTISNDGDG